MEYWIWRIVIGVYLLSIGGIIGAFIGFTKSCDHYCGDCNSDHSGACVPLPEGEPMKKAKRTTHRSSKGKKLYAKRDKSGRFTDIQTYERAHSQDIKRKSKSESKKKNAE